MTYNQCEECSMDDAIRLVIPSIDREEIYSNDEREFQVFQMIPNQGYIIDVPYKKYKIEQTFNKKDQTTFLVLIIGNESKETTKKVFDKADFKLSESDKGYRIELIIQSGGGIRSSNYDCSSTEFEIYTQSFPLGKLLCKQCYYSPDFDEDKKPEMEDLKDEINELFDKKKEAIKDLLYLDEEGDTLNELLGEVYNRKTLEKIKENLKEEITRLEKN